jgi:hypothetical protein
VDSSPAWLHRHVHEPNPTPPGADATIHLRLPSGDVMMLALDQLAALPQRQVTGCYIVSTGHGTSGPFTFGGVTLADLLAVYVTQPWHTVDVVSADGFGNHVTADELNVVTPRPILLATMLDGLPLRREQGLVRLIVPDERDDALRQVKWVAQINVI